jgi:hypothetical protein
MANVDECTGPGVCEAGTWLPTGAAACQPCKAGEYCRGGKNAPQPCGAGTMGSGTYDDDPGNQASMCKAWTRCSPGSQVDPAKPGTALADRACLPCVGSFSTTDNAPTCTPWTACKAGELLVTPGTAVKNQVCKACDAGFFKDGEKCSPWHTCAAGEQTKTAPSPANDRVCEPCPPGQQSKAGDDKCTPIGTCGPGTKKTAGDATTPLKCEECTGMTFSLGNNATSCTGWSTCAAGSFVSMTPSSSMNRGCSPCPSGQYSTGENASECKKQEACEPGTEQTSPGSASAPRVCTKCSKGEYCAGGTAPSVMCGPSTNNYDDDGKPETPCEAMKNCTGQLITNPGSSTTDRVCTPIVIETDSGVPPPTTPGPTPLPTI